MRWGSQMTEHTRIRPAFVSEVAFAQDGTPRPIHIFRAGTFTSMDGTEHTYNADHIRSMLDNFAAGKRKRPPITERHDWGRAVGRIARLWADEQYQNLYAQPAWNKAGRELLTEEVYDGFSCEIEHVDDARVLIGGSLTNYPAIDGLEPVMLEAPQVESVSLSNQSEETQVASPAPPASRPTREHMNIPKENTRMSDEEQITNDGTSAISDEMRTQIAAQALASAGDQLTSTQFEMMQAQFAQMQEAANKKAEQMFVRWQAEQEQRQKMIIWAQNATTATLQRQHALSCTADELTTLLAETPAGPRARWQALLDSTLTNGFVSFEEIGSSAEGDARDVVERWDAAVTAYQQSHPKMAASAVIAAVMRDNRPLYEEYKKGGR